MGHLIRENFLSNAVMRLARNYGVTIVEFSWGSM